jgi:hypothetical protein
MLCESYVFATLSFMWSVSAMCWNLNIYVYCAYLRHFKVLFLITIAFQVPTILSYVFFLGPL